MHSTDMDQMERPLWEGRAMAFVTRSFRQLWGKNNEDILCWLFNQGFSNPFARSQLMGWNKHGQVRDPKLWGLDGKDYPTLFLPKGLVVPHIVNKRLQKITIVDLGENSDHRTMEISGGSQESMVMGMDSGIVALVHDCVDGLYLFQETEGKICVIIPGCGCEPGCEYAPLDAQAREQFARAETVLFFHKGSCLKETPFWEKEVNTPFQKIDCQYEHRKDLPRLCETFI